VTQVDLPGWLEARTACGVIIDAEAVQSNRELIADPARRALLSAEVQRRLAAGAAVTPSARAAARAAQRAWREVMLRALGEADLLALPTVPFFPPPLAKASGQRYTAFTNPVNFAGLPALAVPVRSGGELPASLQLIGPPSAEALLLATGAVIEEAAGFRR
jgi:Asp-tRNA(Asn)/Glu-tRNA(Gln) amidotransferase A subunit family amidase